jgi:ATP-binding cassette subfamily B (MDR/TAP) protein 1
MWTESPRKGQAAAFAELETPPGGREPSRASVQSLESVAVPPASDTTSDSSSKPVPPTRAVPLLELFTYAEAQDKLLMLCGTVGALLAGLAQPVQILLAGRVMNAFNPHSAVDLTSMRSDVNAVALNFTLVGLAQVVFGFVQVACWSYTASRQAKRFRAAYLRAILTKEIAWFDLHDPAQLAAKVADSTATIQEGMGRKIGDGLNFFAMGFAGIVIGLVKGWQLALLMVAFTPFLAATAFVSMRYMAAATQRSIDAYGRAGAIAQEALGNVRTVHMFNAIPHFVGKYGAELERATAAGIVKGVSIGTGMGVIFFVLYCTYSAGLYFGAYKISVDQLGAVRCEGSGCYDGGTVITIFFAIIMGAMALGQAGPSIQAVYAARACAADVFAVIREPSKIDPSADAGTSLEIVAGRVELSGVSFAYPSRPDVEVVRDYSLTVEAGETVALVGPSGSGKSTIVSLLERFYDPVRGRVTLDGVNLQELNVRWLRRQIGLVGQEPTLFATSIMENIRYGSPSATDEQVREAARMANVLDFVAAFPDGFDTEVGERGAQLSGGQKQRIAIARAIIKNPPILLLDEATSALDAESERVVQASLDALLAGVRRTTIVIAHRLSTIQGADRIVVHDGGRIVEVGSHGKLMAIDGGRYKSLVESQHQDSSDGGSDAGFKHSESSVGGATDAVGSVHKRRWSSGRLDRSAVEAARAFDDGDVRNNGKRETNSDRNSDLEINSNSKATDTESEEQSAVVARLWRMSRADWKFLALGSIGALGNSVVFPLWGVILTKIIMLLYAYDKSASEMLREARYWCLGFLALGVFFGLSITAQNYGFAVASQRLVARIRLATFRAMLRQEVGWFDLEENASGALVACLSTESATLQAITAQTLNQGLVNVTSLAVGLGIAFYSSWQMSLATMAVLPIMLLFSYVQSQQVTGTLNNRASNEADAAASSLLSEAVGSIRTVASLGLERSIDALYAQFLDASKFVDIKVGVAGGLMYGFSQGVMFMCIAFLFFLGGKWVADGAVTFEDMFMVMMVLVLTCFAFGMAAQNVTDGSKAKVAAARVFRIIDREPAIAYDEEQESAFKGATTGTTTTTLKETTKETSVHEAEGGDLEFRNVRFAYPSRPGVAVYRDYNLRVRRGQSVALVGASGSGKSTAVALVERFYDPVDGQVTLGGVDLRQLSLRGLRERVSLVSQEPVLFSGTIADNIALGKPGASRAEVVEAAKMANAYKFIQKFPDGLDTDVGDRGAQVSGGQKQRIAIARAILRDPEVLLLDEATSALDSESERVVQASLDALLAAKRRTTVIVAHRLSTIRNADLIAVTQEGAIVELGTHEELMRVDGGVYRALVARQLGPSE